MSERKRRAKCNDLRCGWVGDSDDALRAPNPFDPEDELTACPKCREVNQLIAACDEPGCTKDGSCGTPTEDGYRTTCFAHRPEPRP